MIYGLSFCETIIVDQGVMVCANFKAKQIYKKEAIIKDKLSQC